MKRLFKGVIFVSITLMLFVFLNLTVQPNKDREGIWRTYGRLEKNSIDAIFVGSSKMYTFFNPALLWHDFGFTSYDVAGALLDTNTQYYYVREAFKTQQPKLVVLDTYTLSDDQEQLNPGQKENITIMPWGINKIKAAFQPKIPATESERWIFPVMQYHARLYMPGEVKRSGFNFAKFGKQKKRIFMGYRAGIEVAPQEPIDEPKELDLAVFNRNYPAFERTLNFLKSQNCKVILTITPMANRTAQVNYNKELEKRVSAKYPDIDFLWSYDYEDELGLDYERDFTDPKHLSVSGAEKWTALTGGIFKEKLSEDGPFETSSYGKTTTMFNNDYKRYMKDYK